MPENSTVAHLVESLKLTGKRIAVELNGEIVPKSQHATTPLNAGASLEIVHNDTWKVGGREFTSRLLVGTGKYASLDETREAITESGAEIVTVAIRRTNIGQNAGEASLLDYIPPSKFTYLPNS
eukprot:gene14169-13961_t